MTSGNDKAFPGDEGHGLTKREYLAAAALQGILANSVYEAPRRKKLSGMASDAVAAADALLAALNAEGNQL